MESRILLSTASFARATTYPVAPVTRYTTIADFNGDGHPDIAGAVSMGGFRVVTMLNNGDGTFARPTYFPAGIPRSLAAADFNHDGHVDLAVGGGTDFGNAVVDIFNGNGDGTFVRPPVRYPLPGGGQAIVAADLNGDGWADLVVATNSRVAVLLNNGDGTFAKPVYYNAGGDNPTALAIADFNNDGVPDIAVARGATGDVSILLGNKAAAGTFGPPILVQAGENPQAVAVGDFNHDGNPDLAVVSSQFRGAPVAVILGNGDGTFRPAQRYSGGNFSDAIVVGDFSGTGNDDLVTGSFTGDLKLYTGNGDGTFATPVNVPNAVYAQFLSVADLNGDGKPDLVATPHDGTKVLLNDTGAVVPPPAGSASDQGIGAGGPRSYQFYAPDGTLVKVALAGPGAATLHFSSSTPISIPHGREAVQVTGLQLAGIAATGTTAASRLVITANYGSRSVTFSSITTDGAFGSIDAPRTNLTGPLTLAGGVKSINLLSANGGTITIAGGPAPSIGLGQIGGEIVNSAVPIRSLRVALDAGMTLTAPSIQTLSVGGSMQASMLNFTAPNAAGAFGIGNLSVSRGMITTMVRSAAGIGRVMAGYLAGSTILAGIGPLAPGQNLPAASGDFASPAAIGSITLSRDTRRPSFSNSNVAAFQLGTLDLGTVLTTNTGVPFGLASHHIAALSATDVATGRSFHMTNLSTSAAAALQARGIDPGDFSIRLI